MCGIRKFMRPLTKKYIFECKLKGETVQIWAEYYDGKKSSWLKDIDILEDAGVITLMKDGFRKFLYDIVVIYPADQYNPGGIKHWLCKGTMLTFKKGPDTYHVYPDQSDD